MTAGPRIGLGVGAQQLGRELAAVRQGDGDLLGIARHVIVGDDDARRIDDEAGADCLRLGLRHLLGMALLAEALGELAHELFHLRLAGLLVVARHPGLIVDGAGLHGDRDVDDSRRHLGGEVGEIMGGLAGMAGVVISIGATRAGAVSAVVSASAAKSFLVFVIGNLLFELAGDIWAPPHGTPMAGTLNVCIVGPGASGAKKDPQNKD